MSEKGEGQSPEVPQSYSLPDISEHSKLVEAAKNKYASVGSILSLGAFPKPELDTVYEWWDVFKQNTEKEMQRLNVAISSGTLPHLEEKQLKSEFNDTKELVEPINSRIMELVKQDKIDSSDFYPLSTMIHSKEVKNQLDWLPQVVALGESIVEARGSLDERQIRLRIAQGAWEELLICFVYEKLNYAADTGLEQTTEDDLESQKQQLIASIKHSPWGERETQKNRKFYLGLKKQIHQAEFDPEIEENLKIVWDAARGAVPKDVSALDILDANELVLIGLREGGAFEWNPEEIESSGEEEGNEDAE